MKSKLVIVAGFMVSFFNIQAQNCLPDANFWADYDGQIGGEEIQLSMYKSADGILSGSYRFVKSEKKTYAFTGTEKNCNYQLDVVDGNDQFLGKFVFRYYADKVKKTDNYDGVYTDANSKQTALKLLLRTMVGGSASQRYFELFGTTGEVDAFAEEIKIALINHDKKWLAAKCQYPLVVFAQRGKEITLKNEKEFLGSYDKFFGKVFLDRVKKIRCYSMFSNHVGVLMGKGEVVINNRKNSTASHYEYGISSFTVFGW